MPSVEYFTISGPHGTSVHLVVIGRKVRVTTEHTIWCDRCQDWEQLPIRTKKVFVKQMRRYGWQTRKGQTLCPDCVRELADGHPWDDIGYRRSPR